MCVCVCAVVEMGSGGSYITKVLLLKLTLKNKTKKYKKNISASLFSSQKDKAANTVFYKAANTQESDDPQWMMARCADI